jgi:thioredoxin 1
MPRPLSKKNFKAEIMKAKNLSVVQFKTEWSGACQIIDPIYKELARTYKGQVDFFSIDADHEKELYNQYQVKELPTIFFFKNDELIDHAIGLVSKNKLIAKIENALASLI